MMTDRQLYMQGFELYEVHLARGSAWKRECDKVVALGSGAFYIKDLLMQYVLLLC